MSSKEQFNYMIKSITKEQLQIILEILYNISNEIITISTEDKRRLKKIYNRCTQATFIRLEVDFKKETPVEN